MGAAASGKLFNNATEDNLIDGVTIGLFNFKDTLASSIVLSETTALQAQILKEAKRVSPVYLNTFNYSADWVPGLSGTYVIYPVSVDNSGNRVMGTPVTVTSTIGKGTLPKVLLSQLNDAHLINDSIFLQATVTDAESPGSSLGIQRVGFLVNGVPQPDPNRRRSLVSIEGEVPSLASRPTGCEFHTRCKYATNPCREARPSMTSIHVNEKERKVACHYPLVGRRSD